MQLAPPPNETHTVCLLDWATRYLAYAESKFVAKTWDEKKSALKGFLKHQGPSLSVEALTPGKVLDYLQVQAQARSGYAANKERKNLVAAWNWGMKYMGLPAPNPCLVDRFPEQRHDRYVPPEEDFWKVYKAADNERDRIMLLAYLHLAARRSELFGLRWQDVDFEEAKVRLYTRKRRDGSLEYDWLPMTDELHEALQRLHEQRIGEWVFPEPETGKPYLYRQHFMRRLCKRAGVAPFGFHAIRHLTASILAKSNVPMVDIKEILRHRNLATTERYIKRLSSLRPALQVLCHGGKYHQEPPNPTTKAKKGLSIAA
ncbi:tyrosine-type recombinase/integrase [Thiovibrio sp. JS02]